VLRKYLNLELIAMSKKKSAKKTSKSAKKPTGKKSSVKKKAAKKISLGRPTVTAEEKLFMLFHEDYEARQVFEFLRAETVGDLEQHSPQDIIHRLSRPIRETVDRIRSKLADRNRCLADDEQFAADISHRAIHFALFVFEDAQMLNLVGEGVGVTFVIVLGDAEQD